MKLFSIIIISIFITSCGNIPAPSLIAPSEPDNIKKVSYGDSPDNYQKILKNYLIKNLKNYKTARVEFINEPARLTIEHLGDTYSGYRLCLSINEQRGDYYLGYRNHFFMINNNNVTLHLYDSGLLTIPFEYCVTRDTSREIFIDDIPEESKDIAVEKMDEVKIAKRNQDINVIGNTYIICNFNEQQKTYVFNESKSTFKLINKLEETAFSVDFNDAFIVATRDNIELSINRVSGDAKINNDLKSGNCRLTDKRRF